MKKNKKMNFSKKCFIGFIALLSLASCERDLSDDITPATFNKTAEVFIDGFSGGMDYFAFGTSKLTAFSIDTDVTFSGTQSMRFDIPNASDTDGNFAGGIFKDLTGRDLTEYNALTFWARASKGETLNQVGFGQDFEDGTFLVTASGLELNTAWTQYTIPIPNPSKLTQEKGLFWIAEGTDAQTGQTGYTLWIDEVKFENLGNIAQPRPKIFDGVDVEADVFVGATRTATGLTQTYNVANGSNVTVTTTSGYFDFQSSNESVAQVDEAGVITAVGYGSAVITAIIDGVLAEGSLALEVESLDGYVNSPVPVRDAADVISIFSDAYTNVGVDFLTSNYQPFQSTTSSHFTAFDSDGADDNVLNYLNFNFVGIEFNSTVSNIDATEMTHLHVDLFVPGELPAGSTIRIKLRDVGINGVINTNEFTGGPTEDDSEINTVVAIPTLVQGSWVSVDFDITGIAGKANLGQIVFDSDAGISPTQFYADNIYFYK